MTNRCQAASTHYIYGLGKCFCDFHRDAWINSHVGVRVRKLDKDDGILKTAQAAAVNRSQCQWEEDG